MCVAPFLARVEALLGSERRSVIERAKSFGVLAIFFFLTWVHSRKWFHGQVLLTFAIAYPVLRSILEIFRGDAGRGYVIDGVLSTSQFISIFVALASLVTLFILRQKQKNKAALS